MRFMSILGLCLMAVFALVQSLPLQDTRAVQDDPERAQLHEDIALHQQRAQVLKAELRRLLLLIEQADAAKSERERALSDAERQLTEVVDRTEQVRVEQRRVSGELKSLQQRLERGRYALAALQQAADDKSQSLRALEQRLKLETRKLDDIRQKTRDIRLQRAEEQRRQAMRMQQRQREEEQRKQAAARREAEQRRQAALRIAEQKRRQSAREQNETAARQQQSRVTAEPVKAPAPEPSKKRFTLRFASDEALQRQVAAGQVSLFAMADRQAWRLSLPHGRPVFTDAAFPGWFHEMAASTVPTEFVRQLKVAVAPEARGSIVWGVQLPPATKRDIASLTRGRAGGDLVIASNGRVSLAGE